MKENKQIQFECLDKIFEVQRDLYDSGFGKELSIGISCISDIVSAYVYKDSHCNADASVCIFTYDTEDTASKKMEQFISDVKRIKNAVEDTCLDVNYSKYVLGLDEID